MSKTVHVTQSAIQKYQKSMFHSEVGKQTNNFLDYMGVTFNVAEVFWVLYDHS